MNLKQADFIDYLKSKYKGEPQIRMETPPPANTNALDNLIKMGGIVEEV